MKILGSLELFYKLFLFFSCTVFFLRQPGAAAGDIHKKGTDRGKGVHFFSSSACDAPALEALGGFPNASSGVCAPCLDGCLFLHRRVRLIITQINLM